MFSALRKGARCCLMAPWGPCCRLPACRPGSARKSSAWSGRISFRLSTRPTLMREWTSSRHARSAAIPASSRPPWMFLPSTSEWWRQRAPRPPRPDAPCSWPATWARAVTLPAPWAIWSLKISSGPSRSRYAASWLVARTSSSSRPSSTWPKPGPPWRPRARSATCPSWSP